MHKRFGIKTLLGLTTVIAIVVAACVSLSERARIFTDGLKTPDIDTQKQLMVDAELHNSRSFVTSSPLHNVAIENRTMTDYLLFRQYCKVTFTTSEQNGGSFSSFNCTSRYSVGLFSTGIVDSNDRWVMTVDESGSLTFRSP